MRDPALLLSGGVLLVPQSFSIESIAFHVKHAIESRAEVFPGGTCSEFNELLF